MKKFLLSVCFGAASFIGFAQSFSTETLDTTLYGTPLMADFYGDVDFFNNTSTSNKMVWIVDSTNLPVGWEFSVCDQAVCNPIGMTNDIWYLPVTGGYMNVHFYPNNVDGEGFVTFRVYNYDIPTDEIYLTFRGSTLRSDVLETKDNLFNMFPNPVDETLSLSMDTDKSIVKIYNTQGQLVLTDVINSIGINNLNVSELSKGTYVVEVTSSKYSSRKVLIKE